MARLEAWLAGPIVIGHAGCIASPAVAVALGMPIVMPICGGGPEALLQMLGPVVMQATGALLAAAILSRLARIAVRLRVRIPTWRKAKHEEPWAIRTPAGRIAHGIHGRGERTAHRSAEAGHAPRHERGA